MPRAGAAGTHGATLGNRALLPDGSIAHASIIVNGATVYLSDAPADMDGDAASPTKLGGTTVLLHQYVADVDASTAKAVAAGATLLREPEDQFYGDRAAMIVDPLRTATVTLFSPRFAAGASSRSTRASMSVGDTSKSRSTNSMIC